MDNFHIDITADKRVDLAAVIAVALSRQKTADSWRTDTRPSDSSVPRIVFGWGRNVSEAGWTPFPASMNAQQLHGIVLGWLSEADYGQQPGHDGSNGRGWRLYNEQWSRVQPYTYAIFAVEPQWAWYGK
jgi:hypothetical protein